MILSDLNMLRKKNVAGLLLIAIVSVSYSFAQLSTEKIFNGTWKLNSSKSTWGPMNEYNFPSKFVVIQADSSMSIEGFNETEDHKEFSAKLEFVYNKEVMVEKHGSKYLLTHQWLDGKERFSRNIIVSKTATPDVIEDDISDFWQLSEDKSELIIQRTIKIPHMTVTVQLIYDKQKL